MTELAVRAQLKTAQDILIDKSLDNISLLTLLGWNKEALKTWREIDLQTIHIVMGFY